MHRRFIGAALVLALASAAAPGLAQGDPPPAASPQAPAAAARYSVDSKFAVLFADPNADKVVKTFFQKRRQAAGKPEPTAELEQQARDLVRDMTPREVSQYPQANLDEAALSELDAELAKVPFPSSVAAAAPAPAAVITQAADPSPKK